MSGVLSSHVWQCGFDYIQWSEVVDFELIADQVHGLLRGGEFFDSTDES